VRRRTILFGVGGFVALLVVGAAATLLLVDANAYKARFEAAASQTLGMQVSIGGRLGIAFFPGLLATLEDVHVHNRGLEIASAKQASPHPEHRAEVRHDRHRARQPWPAQPEAARFGRCGPARAGLAERLPV
jgi:AsmA protein